jgi:hypothetical protein
VQIARRCDAHRRSFVTAADQARAEDDRC